jgi:hypothetical protein
VVAALVAINHVLGADPAPPAQVRQEQEYSCRTGNSRHV